MYLWVADKFAKREKGKREIRERRKQWSWRAAEKKKKRL